MKGDRDKERKVRYKLPKRKEKWVKGTFHAFFRAARDTHTYHTNVHTHSNVETVKTQESFTSSTA